ncbi:MAG: radical SAM (seleno)protein TrsS [Clostridiaceae bacterium]|nr:radical SAM protein [Eubacteriales bacterium]
MSEKTVSLCPVCLRRLPAKRAEESGNIYLIKECPEHGEFRTILWRGSPSMDAWMRPEENTPPKAPEAEPRLGCPYDCGLCTDHLQAACCVLIEVTGRCSLGCPLCFADAGGAGEDISIEEFDELLAYLKEQSPDSPFNLQLSGGEPAEHPEIAELVRRAKKAGFSHVQLNTNGLRLARDPGFAAALGEAGLSSVFLQFDGTADAVYTALRGRPLLKEKCAAIESCAAAGLPVVLTMALVPGVNTGDIGPTLQYAFDRMPTVRGIHFLPVGHMGRRVGAPSDALRFTLPELIRALAVQSGYRMAISDFLPITSGSCMCAFHGNFLVEPDGRIISVTEPGGACCPCKRDAIASARAYLARRWGSAYVENGDGWDMFLKNTEERGFSVTAMAFMDAWNFDVARLRKCRFQVAARDHRLIPFCAYYVTSETGERLYGV